MGFFTGLIESLNEATRKKLAESIDTNNYQPVSMDMANNPSVSVSSTADQEDASILLSNKKRNTNGVSSNLGIRV